MKVIDSIVVANGRASYGLAAGRNLDTPVVADDGTIWLTLNFYDKVFVDLVRIDPATMTSTSSSTQLVTAQPPQVVGSSVWPTGHIAVHRQ